MKVIEKLRERLLGGTFLFELRKRGFGSLLDLPTEFCSDPDGDEWHSLVLGMMTPFDREKYDENRIPASYPEKVKAMILREYWYYRFGRAVGRIVLFLLLLAVGANVGGFFV